MLPPRPQRAPFNLTAAAERMKWEEVGRSLRVHGGADGGALEICGMEHMAGQHQHDELDDAVYVVVSGYGMLHWGDTALECTVGDVLFVPGGRAHHFEPLSGKITLWRISAIPPGPRRGVTGLD
jgi:mannose-6-phosphate isomerase-like protein (cupin superfamily)